MQIGIDSATLAHRRLSVDEALDLACDLGLSGVQFLSPGQIDSRLTPAALARVREKADTAGLYLEFGLPTPNPVRASQEQGREIAIDERAHQLLPMVDALAALGCTHATTAVGDLGDRFRIDTRWPDQQVATLQVIKRLAPRLREHRIRLAIENHGDFTAEELLRFVGAVDQDVAAVALNPANLPLRLDDPLPAAERLAPLTLAIHATDAVLAFTPRGLAWQPRPVGSGALPIADIITLVHRHNPEIKLSIHLSPQTLEIPIYDRSFLDAFSGLRPHDLAAIVALAANCEQRFREGTLPNLDQLDSIPWTDRDLDGLARSVGYLRPLVSMLDRVGSRLHVPDIDMP